MTAQGPHDSPATLARFSWGDAGTTSASTGSLARAAGRGPAVVQKAMGHESITTTARINAHLYDDELDSVAAALDRIGRGG